MPTCLCTILLFYLLFVCRTDYFPPRNLLVQIHEQGHSATATNVAGLAVTVRPVNSQCIANVWLIRLCYLSFICVLCQMDRKKERHFCLINYHISVCLVSVDCTLQEKDRIAFITDKCVNTTQSQTKQQAAMTNSSQKLNLPPSKQPIPSWAFRHRSLHQMA